MTTVQSGRGRPLVALILILGAWIGLRAAFWDLPSFHAVKMPTFAHLQTPDGPRAGANGSADDELGFEPVGPQSVPGAGLFAFTSENYDDVSPSGPVPAGNWLAGRQFRQLPRMIQRFAMPPRFGMAIYPWPSAGPSMTSSDAGAHAPSDAVLRGPVPVRTALAQEMLWMAAVSRMPLPMELLAGGGDAAFNPAYAPRAKSGSVNRWSADAWLLLRKGGKASLVNGIAPATYGASQMGAVLRYRLGPESGHRPSAYLRTTLALNGSREREAAIGLSARPIPRVPVAAAAEVRLSNWAGRRRVRPAVLGWTEIPRFKLPLGASGEVYAQGGYVGGEFKTAFVDAQARADHGVVKLGKAEMRAGAGAWAGAQKGASRVDVGPTATVGVPFSGTASARLGFDWRFRLTGNAEPKSGPAVTLSAGF